MQDPLKDTYSHNKIKCVLRDHMAPNAKANVGIVRLVQLVDMILDIAYVDVRNVGLGTDVRF